MRMRMLRATGARASVAQNATIQSVIIVKGAGGPKSLRNWKGHPLFPLGCNPHMQTLRAAGARAGCGLKKLLFSQLL